ncbi:thioredoxin domain-containing protein [bacterium]|nr:thioredoxin domain-containing protein [bacterium]
MTWIEYSDLECPFCSRMHESGTPDALKKIYENDLNIIFQHSPLSFHQNAQDAAEITECL